MPARGQKVTNYEARLRAQKGVRLRARGYTYAEIAVECGYRRPAAAYTAVKRELARHAPMSTDEAREMLLENARHTSKQWYDVFDAAAQRRDLEGMAEAHRGLCKDRDLVARITGALTPERHEIEVKVSAVEKTREALLAQIEQQSALPVVDAEVVEESA